MRRGVRWLGVAALACGLATATAAAVPPQGDFTVTPNPPNQGQSATFTCTPCPSSTSVAWDLDVRMRMTRSGEVTIVTKTVTVNGRPAVAFDFAPASPFPGQAVAFSSEVSDPEGDPIVSRAWTFGDGETATGVAPEHTYDEAGTYTVGLTATDSRGATTTASRQIVVQADPGPTSSFDFSPAVPDVGEPVTFTSRSEPSWGSITELDWDLDGDGAFADFHGSPASWTFDKPGTHEVGLRVTQSNGEPATSVDDVRVNAPPSAGFSWSPSSPVAGEWVDLVSTSIDFEGPLAALNWDLDGDGKFGDGSEPQVSYPFTEPGTYDIGLQVTDSDGSVSTVRQQVVVVAPAPDPPPGGSGQPTGEPTGGSGEPTGGTGERPAARRRPRLMSPFPVVRIAGTVMPDGAFVSVLSVRAPRGSRVRVDCQGRGCPVGSVARTSATRVVRFPRFERRLRAGIRLRLFVRQTDRIGKYTSFLIRAGAPPKRVDRCLFPARRGPAPCP